MSGGGKVLCDRNPASTGRRFLNPNGFSGEGPLVQAARLMAVDENSPTNSGCWAVQGSASEVGISPCDADSKQKLYVRSPAM